MINGYTVPTSVFPGDVIKVYVSTDAPEFRVDFYRQGSALALVWGTGWLKGLNAPDHDADEDWGIDSTRNNQVRAAWPAYDVAIPIPLKGGVFIAMFVEGDGNGNDRGNTPPLDTSTPDARSGKALFVVRNPAPAACAQFLYKLSLFTYQAYNFAGGWSLYQQAPVSLRRPGGGTGGTPWDFLYGYFNPGNPTVPLQTFAQWDAPFIQWLENTGFAIDFVTDLDVHIEETIFNPYSLAFSVGHDEYWSDATRDRAEQFIADGGNFAFFSGNTCWWRVQFDDAIRFRRTANWWDPAGPNRPENSLTGVSYRNAGEGDRNRPPIGFAAQNTQHWIFDGTGLNEMDVFGQNEMIVGYECDGANFDRNAAAPYAPLLNDGTPASFVILGIGDVSTFNANEGNAAATMGIYTSGGIAFTAATTDWPRVVGLNEEPRTVQITANVLRGLSGVEQVNVSDIAGPTITGPMTSWQTSNGPYNVEHLAGVDSQGNVIVFYWSPQADWQAVNVSAISGTTLAAGAPLTSWQTPNGPYNVEHLAGVDAQGNVIVFYWSPQADWQAVNVSAISGTTLAAGAPLTSWQTPNGPYNVEHLAGVDDLGNVIVFYWSPQADWQAVNVSAISGTTLSAAAPLTNWQTPNGPYNVEHLAGVDAQGNVIVFYWSPQADWQAVNVSAISGTTLAAGAPLTSWQTPNGPYNVEHLAGIDDQGNVMVFYWSPQADWQAVNVSSITNQQLATAGPISSWQQWVAGPRGNVLVEKLVGLRSDGAICLFAWTPQTDWCVQNMSLLTSALFSVGLASWQTPDGNRLVQHVAGLDQNSRVALVYWSS